MGHICQNMLGVLPATVQRTSLKPPNTPSFYHRDIRCTGTVHVVNAASFMFCSQCVTTSVAVYGAPVPQRERKGPFNPKYFIFFRCGKAQAVSVRLPFSAPTTFNLFLHKTTCNHLIFSFRAAVNSPVILNLSNVLLRLSKTFSKQLKNINLDGF